MATTNRSRWTAEEDEILLGLVLQYSGEKWPQISKRFNNLSSRPRNSKQCRERYLYQLDPDIRKGAWTEAETQKLFSLHRIHGNNWSRISKSIPQRTDLEIKNFFHLQVKKRLKEYNLGFLPGERIKKSMKSLVRDKKLTETIGLGQEAPLVYEEEKPAISETLDEEDQMEEEVRSYEDWYFENMTNYLNYYYTQLPFHEFFGNPFNQGQLNK